MPKRDDNFVFLLAAMLLFLVASPVVEMFGFGLGGKVNNILFATTLLVAIFSMHTDRRVLYSGIALAGASVVAGVLAVSTGDQVWNYLSFAAFFSYLLLAIVAAGHEVIEDSATNVNRLLGAICIFLLLGLIFSMLYALVHEIDPDAFRGVPAELGILDSTTWTYYSFTTLTTLGYGDIAPVSSIARTLAFLEAILGQFYVAILVAGLVGTFLAERRK